MQSAFDLFLRDVLDSNSFINWGRDKSAKISYPFNITREENQITYEISALKLAPKDIDISLNGNTIMIKTVEKEVHLEDKKEWLYKGIKNSKFNLQFIIPDEYDATSPEVLLDRGLLTLVFKKRIEALPKKIEIIEIKSDIEKQESK